MGLFENRKRSGMVLMGAFLGTGVISAVNQGVVGAVPQGSVADAKGVKNSSSTLLNFLKNHWGWFLVALGLIAVVGVIFYKIVSNEESDNRTAAEKNDADNSKIKDKVVNSNIFENNIIEEEKRRKEELKSAVKKIVDDENVTLKEQYKGLPEYFGNVFLEFDEKTFSVRTTSLKEEDIQREYFAFDVKLDEKNKENTLKLLKERIKKFKEKNTEHVEQVKKLVNKVEELNKALGALDAGDLKLKISTYYRAFRYDNEKAKKQGYDFRTVGLGNKQIFAVDFFESNRKNVLLGFDDEKGITVEEQVKRSIERIDNILKLVASGGLIAKANDSLKDALPEYYKKGFRFFVSRDGKMFFAPKSIKGNMEKQKEILDLDKVLIDQISNYDMGEEEIDRLFWKRENVGLCLGEVYGNFELPEKIIERCKKLSKLKGIIDEENRKLTEAECAKKFFVSVGLTNDVLYSTRFVTKEKFDTCFVRFKEGRHYPVIYFFDSTSGSCCYFFTAKFDKDEDYMKLRKKIEEKENKLLKSGNSNESSMKKDYNA